MLQCGLEDFPFEPASAAGLLDCPALLAEFRQQKVPVVALDLDRAILDGSACAAALLQLLGQLIQFGRGQRHAGDHGDPFAGTALGFAAYADDAVRDRCCCPLPA